MNLFKNSSDEPLACAMVTTESVLDTSNKPEFWHTQQPTNWVAADLRRADFDHANTG